MNRVKYHIFDSVKVIMAVCISNIIKVFVNNVYLVGERVGDASDNGYHFFKYVREKHKNDLFYYVIKKDCKELDNIKKYGNIIYYDTFKHYIYYFLAYKLICGHVGSCTPTSSLIWILENKNYLKRKRIFIQHGIVQSNVDSLKKQNTRVETFVCGAKKEYEFVKDNFGYQEKNIKYLGLCRFDNLQNYDVKNQILLMPTWRQWFGMEGTSYKLSHEAFENTEYCKKYKALLNNKGLINFLRSNNLKLVFYPHYEVQRYIDIFQNNNKEIIIAKKEEFSVQELLKESKILITDYSSIAFDFAYMYKPVVYYTFDSEKYNKEHYKKGYFDLNRDGFGPVVKEENELVNEIMKSYQENEELKIYRKRAKEFFELHDENNCKRTYLEVIGG